MKATIKAHDARAGRRSFFLKGVERDDRLRAETVLPHRLLVVLFLPENAREWLKHTEEQLVLKRCAYWASLKGAPESANESGQTVYLPEDQPFSPEDLIALLSRLAHLEDLRYEP